MAGYGVELSCPGEEVVQRLIQVLENHGFRVARAFDLRSAMEALPVECPCPYHGTTQCTCGYTVLLIYGSDAARQPALPLERIAVHSHHEQTWLTFLPNWEGQDEGGDPLAVAQTARLARGLVAAVSDICV